MTTRISGTFEVTIGKESVHDAATDSGIGRMTLNKRYHGSLDARSVGEMLTGMTATRGSAGYVAIERVEGTLDGRSGTFMLQHGGTMNRGAPTLAVEVIPDSGTEALVGLEGRMAIRIEGGQHFYDFDYLIDDGTAVA